MRIIQRRKRATRNEFGNLNHYRILVNSSDASIGSSCTDGESYVIIHGEDGKDIHVNLTFSEIQRLMATLPKTK